MLKKIILVLIFIGIISVVCIRNANKPDLYKSIMKRGKLTVGISYDSKPFAYRDNDGHVYGIDADIAREISRRIFGKDKRVIFKQIAPKERINAIIAGDVDIVISTMTITPQREKFVIFSDPYYIAGQAICVRENSCIRGCSDLNKKKIIVVIGTTAEKNIRDFIPKANVQGYIKRSDAFNAFKHGEGDAITMDDSLLSGFVMEHDGYKILPIRFTEEPYGIAFKKSDETDSLRKNINKILNDIKLDGTFDSIKGKWGFY